MLTRSYDADKPIKNLENTKAKFRRRSDIEPIIRHLAFDHRMLRKQLKSNQEDFINCVRAAAGFNIKRCSAK